MEKANKSVLTLMNTVYDHCYLLYVLCHSLGGWLYSKKKANGMCF